MGSTTWTLAAEEFTPPGIGIFNYPPIPFLGPVTKPVLQIILVTVILAVFFLVASRNLKMMPTKGQYASEWLVDWTSKNVRDQVGPDFRRYVPLVLGLFSFILVNNLLGIIPFFQFPSMSRIGFPIALAIFVYVFYHYNGIRSHGLWGYIKHMSLPPGVPVFIAPLIVVIELLQNLLVKPLALALRVFAAMFAGHLILVLAVVAGEFLLSAGGALIVAAPFAFIAAIAFTFLEALVMVIQAYVFALLAAVFIGQAVSTDH